MPNTDDPVTAQLIALRRAQILEAATRVFAEKGFHRATTKDIARAAGIAEGTIYTYFASKTDLLLGILNRLNETEQRAEHFTAGSEWDFRTFLITYLHRRLATIWPNTEVFRAVLPELLVNSDLREKYFQQVIEPTILVAEQYFQMQIEQGQMRAVNVPLTVRTIAGMVLGLLILQLLGDQLLAERWTELPEVLATMIFDGLELQDDQATS
jgi:AcrR family transcriptional regulator